jgi:hypothetical protein
MLLYFEIQVLLFIEIFYKKSINFKILIKLNIKKVRRYLKFYPKIIQFHFNNLIIIFK